MSDPDEYKYYFPYNSSRPTKKFLVLIKKDGKIKWIHFGDTRYDQYEDKTPLQLYKDQNHYDIKRRNAYRKRAMHIKDQNGNLTFLDKIIENYNKKQISRLNYHNFVYFYFICSIF